VSAPDEQLRELVVAMHVLSRTLRRSAELQAGFDPLPPSEFELLQFVGTHPGATVSEIARGLRLQTSNVSNTVRHLAGRGLLERTPDEHDQRRIRIRLSPESSGHRREVEEGWATALARLLGDLPPEETERLLAAAPALVRLAELAATGRAAPVP
jgi:DNA-binding MarR family transcriptional regulator